MIKTKNFRRRVDDEGDVDDPSPVKAPSVAASKGGSSKKDKAAKAAAKRPSAPKLLSFAEDEDGADVVTRPPSDKKEKPVLLSFETDDGLLKSRKKAAGFGASQASGPKVSTTSKEKAAVLHSNFQPQAGEYTKEKLLELQKNTIRLGGAKPPLEKESKPLEPVVVLKGQVKPVVSSTVEVKTVVTEREAFGTSDGTLLASRARVTSYQAKLETEDAENRLGLMGIGTGAEAGGVTHIPDAAAIAAAKAKRERLRQAQAQPDYIPVGNSDSLDLRGRSRDAAPSEMGEDSSSDDEGEMRTRIAMMGELPNEKVKAGVFESMEDKIEDRMLAGHREDDEEDEERRWEEEQLRKGFGKRVDDSASWVGVTPLVPRQDSLHGETYFSGALTSAPLPSASWGFSGQNVDAMTISQRADAALSTLYETLRRTRETHDRTNGELQKTEDNLSSSLLNISTLENSLAMTGDKYVYMQKLRDYIAVLCDFLKSKAPLIEELEEHMQRLHEERATAVSERRSADSADEMLEIEAAVNAAMSVLNKGASASTAATVAANAAANASSARENLSVQLDEFGRDINLQKRMEVKRRAQAREGRRARASKQRLESSDLSEADACNGLQVEGEATSDESESEEQAFRSGCAEILETADRVFADAAEEFSHLSSVKEKLESWKRLHSTAYRDAYVSLSAPSIFAPYVRLELLKWDPLYSDVDFDSMKWHSLLFDYGMPDNGIEVSPDDMDADLVPKLVEKVALPVLHHEIAHCWDILSGKSTSHAVAAVKVILNYVPPSCDALQDLLAAVRSKLLKAVEDLEVPSWSHQIISIVPQAAQIAAYRFGTSVRLLKNIAYWKDVLAMPLLERLALEDLLNGKMLPHLRNLLHSPYDAISRAERVVIALSGVWIGPNVTSRPKLQPLVDFLVSIGRAIEKRKGVSSDDVLGLARRLKRMLVELNEYDRARSLSKTFQIREAL